MFYNTSMSSIHSILKQLPASLSLAGRTAIVTGSSSGLGRAIALRLARLGCNVVCSDLHPRAPKSLDPPGSYATTPTHELIATIGGQSAFYELDVSNLQAYRDVVDQVVSSHSTEGRLDIIVNNAGMGGYQQGKEIGGIHLEDPDFAAKVLQVNLMGVWNGTKVAAEKMLSQEILPFPCDLEIGPELGDSGSTGQIEGFVRGSRGVIINVASIHGMVAGPFERESRGRLRGSCAA
jgi:NAD(P)-dependent dehydrogenase (short-subunit alcohol dehydrogenase family)